MAPGGAVARGDGRQALGWEPPVSAATDAPFRPRCGADGRRRKQTDSPTGRERERAAPRGRRRSSRPPCQRITSGTSAACVGRARLRAGPAAPPSPEKTGASHTGRIHRGEELPSTGTRLLDGPALSTSTRTPSPSFFSPQRRPPAGRRRPKSTSDGRELLSRRRGGHWGRAEGVTQGPRTTATISREPPRFASGASEPLSDSPYAIFSSDLGSEKLGSPRAPTRGGDGLGRSEAEVRPRRRVRVAVAGRDSAVPTPSPPPPRCGAGL